LFKSRIGLWSYNRYTHTLVHFENFAEDNINVKFPNSSPESIGLVHNDEEATILNPEYVLRIESLQWRNDDENFDYYIHPGSYQPLIRRIANSSKGSAGI
jgi:hypothetical protein